jgi:predicted transcriptional regulator
MTTPRKKDVLTEPSPAEIAAVREGREDLAAGRQADHRTVTGWLRTWGDKKRKAPPTDKS